MSNRNPMKSSIALGILVLACGGTTVQRQPDGGAGANAGGAGTGGSNAGGSAGASGAAGASTGGAGNGGSNAGGSAAGGGNAGGSAGAGASAGHAGAGGSNTGGGGGASGKGGANTGGTGGAAWTCPETPPHMGDPCTRPIVGSGTYVTAHCAWGNDPRIECRTTAACQMNGTWYVTAPNAQACTAPPLPSDCPDPPPAEGTVCSAANETCNYADGTLCVCSGCAHGRAYPICQVIMPPQWTCSPRPMGCPIIVPNAGTACDTPGASCGVVGNCMSNVVCQDGQWIWNGSSCPVCASPDTPIATPDGERRIADLRLGDLVYSVDHDAIVAVPLVATGSTPVTNHHVVRVELGDGTVLEMSAGHPTGEGVPFGNLSAGNAFDDLHRIRSAEVVPYTHDRTYDILPGSTTGTYFAGGAWVGSTLHQAADAPGVDDRREFRRAPCLQ